MPQVPQRIYDQLSFRKQENSLRELRTSSGLIDFCSNDYLGFARSVELCKRIEEKVAECDMNGATGSRLISGNSKFIENTERKLAEYFSGEASLIFNSGYIANQSILSSVPQRGDMILYDELVHASIKDGMRLSFASKASFKHNDIQALESQLQKHKDVDVYVVVESIYSMDGDECPLLEIVELCDKYGAYLIVDEAHSTGIIGEYGEGLCVQHQLHERIFARIYTFGKAMGIHGACIVGSEDLRQFLINFSRPLIYTTALPPHSVVAIDQVLNHLKANSNEIALLRDRIAYFRNRIDEVSSVEVLDSYSPIQGIIVSGNDNVRKVAQSLQTQGMDVRPILSPTVAEGKERLRICIHSFNTEKEIDLLVKGLSV